MGAVNLRRGRDLPGARATPAAGARGPGGRRAGRRAGALRRLRGRRAAVRLRDDVHPDDPEPDRRALARSLPLHVRDGGGGLRALHRAGKLRGLGAAQDSSAADRRVAVAAGGACSALLYFELENAPYYAHVVRSLFANVPAGFYPYHFFVFLGILAVLLRPDRALRRAAAARLPPPAQRDGRAGRRRGPALRLEHARLAARRAARRLRAAVLRRSAPGVRDRAGRAGGGSRASSACWCCGCRRSRRPLATAAALGGCLAPAGLGAVSHERRALPPAGAAAADLRRTRRALREPGRRARRSCSTTTTPPARSSSPTATRARCITNGKPDGNLRYDYTTMALAGLVPALLSDDPSRAFVIGWGLGITAGVLGSLDDVKEVDRGRDLPRRAGGRAALRRGQPERVQEPEDPPDPQRRLPRPAAQRGPVRRDRVGAQQPVGDGRRDALQRGVPARRPRPADARRRLRPVVPSLRGGRRDREHRPAHLQAGLRGHGDLVHPRRRRAVAGLQGSVAGPRHRPAAAAVRARRLSAGLRARRGRKLDPAAGARGAAARRGGRDGAARSAPHRPAPDPERQRGPRLLRRRPGAAAAHALGGRQPGGRAAAPCCGGRSRETSRARTCWRSSPATPVRWRGPIECAVLLARWTASHPDSPRLAQAARDLRSADYTGAEVDVRSRPRSSRHWWSCTVDTPDGPGIAGTREERGRPRRISTLRTSTTPSRSTVQRCAGPGRRARRTSDR